MPGRGFVRMGVVMAAGDGTVVEVGGPWVGVSGVADEVSDGVAELFVACPAEADGAGLARCRVEGATPARQASDSGVGKRARQAPISANSRAARTRPARGRLVKMCASACRVSCSSIGTDKALICSLTVRSTVKSARVTWVSAAPSSPMAPRGAEVRRAWRTARSVRPQ